MNKSNSNHSASEDIVLDAEHLRLVDEQVRQSIVADSPPPFSKTSGLGEGVGDRSNPEHLLMELNHRIASQPRSKWTKDYHSRLDIELRKQAMFRSYSDSDVSSILAQGMRGEDVVVSSARSLYGTWFPVGNITLLGSEIGVGKSMLMYKIAADITVGLQNPLFNRYQGKSAVKPVPGKVLYVSLEDGVSDTILPAFKANGGDVTNFEVWRGTDDDGNSLDSERAVVKYIEAWLTDINNTGGPPAVMVIIDVLLSIPASNGADPLTRPGADCVMGPFKNLAEDHDLVLVGITHTNKGNKQNAKDSFMGGGGLGKARSGLTVYPMSDVDGGTDENGEANGLRFIHHSKVNGTYEKMPSVKIEFSYLHNFKYEYDDVKSLDFDPDNHEVIDKVTLVEFIETGYWTPPEYKSARASEGSAVAKTKQAEVADELTRLMKILAAKGSGGATIKVLVADMQTLTHAQMKSRLASLVKRGMLNKNSGLLPGEANIYTVNNSKGIG